METYKNVLAKVLPLFFGALALAGCTPAADVQPRVIVTIEPLRYMVEQTADGRVAVQTMVPGGGSPETYEPTARQMAELSSGLLYVKVGELGFERTWMERLKANAPQLPIVNASEGIAPLGNDPHTWTSPNNALVMARNVYEALRKVQPGDSAAFRNGYERLCRRIKQLDARIDSLLATASPRSFLIYHPSLSYFARDYHLNQIAIEEEGREPSAASLQKVIGEAKAAGARLLFVQEEFGGSNTETVGKAVGAREVRINPLGYDWEKEMEKVADALANQ